MNNRNQLDYEFSLPAVQKKADFTIRNSFNLKKTKSRITFVILFGSITIILFILLGFFVKNIQLLTILSILYVVLTLLEKIGYGFGVLAYKKVIQKILYDDEYRDKYIDILKLRKNTASDNNA